MAIVVRGVLRRNHPRKSITLPPRIIVRLEERAASAGAGRNNFSAQIAAAVDEADGNARTLCRQLSGDVGVILGVIARMEMRHLLPRDCDDLAAIRRAADRMRRLISPPK